ncbi:MAG: type II toxin-antitoxin system VapC family toxin [Rubrobacter sp.]
MYLLDTDILSNLMKRSPSSELVEKLTRVPVEQQFTSSITLGELVYGAHRLTDRTATLMEKIEEVLLPNLPVLGFDTAAARRYGQIRAELERHGTPIGEADMRIAAIALSRGLNVVTANERHFRRVPGLRTENWLEG